MFVRTLQCARDVVSPPDPPNSHIPELQKSVQYKGCADAAFDDLTFNIMAVEEIHSYLYRARI